jgi:hypothetical protein
VTLLYKHLLATSPEYDADEWARCDALYAGGRKLLKNPAVVKQLFHRHNAETADVYEERLARAYYIPYAGQVIDFIVAALFGEKLTLELDGEAAADKFYDEFQENVAGQLGPKLELRQLLRRQILTALKKRRAWTLLDLPPAPAEQHAALADEEATGQRAVYACPVEPECVRRWKRDRQGNLEWVLLMSTDTEAQTLDDSGIMVREEFTYYDRVGWRRWNIEYAGKDKRPKPETPVDEIPGVKKSEGLHSFGRVPLSCMELPEGLHAMGKLESIATEHFNKSCALSWGEYKGLFQFLAFFQEPPKPGDTSGVTEDVNRYINQKIGPGRAWRGSQGDRIEVIAPDAAPFTHALESLKILRDEMFRVVHYMSLAVDNSGAALQRSGASKEIDKAGESVVLTALGGYVRDHAIELMGMAAAGRGDKDLKWVAQGMESYEDVSLDALVNQEVMLETIPIPSPTFQVERKYELARRQLGERATPEMLEKIHDELEAAITVETLMPIGDPGAAPGEDGSGEDDDEEPRGTPVAPPSKGKISFKSE